MVRWLVGSMPSWLLFFGLIILIVGVALLAVFVVRRRFPGLRGDERSEVTQFAFMFVGFVYAFFVGFVVSAMWGQINSADDALRTEGATAIQMARDSTVFDQADGDRIRQSLLAYEKAAVAEWPVAAYGDSLPAADEALKALYTTYGAVQTTTDTQKAFQASSFDSLRQISQLRSERILRAGSDVGPSGALWTVFLLTSVLVISCVVVYGVQKAGTHYVLVAVVALLVAANVFLVLELTHPYVGEASTTSQPLQAAVNFLQA
jgi:hypothetical protein